MSKYCLSFEINSPTFGHFLKNGGQFELGMMENLDFWMKNHVWRLLWYSATLWGCCIDPECVCELYGVIQITL